MPTPPNLNTSPPAARESGESIHRRESWWQIWLPFGLGVLLIIGLAVIAGLSTDPQALLRVGALSDILFTIMVLCPIFICLLPIFVILVAVIYGMHRLHNSVGTPLERLERATETMSQRIDETTERVNRRVADWSARFEELTPILDTFDDSSEETTHAEPPETPKPEGN